MKLGRGNAGSDAASDLVTSENGWVRVDCDPRLWIPCPVQFPDGLDRDSWATAMSSAWWEQSGRTHSPNAIGQLATMLRAIHEQGYARVRCHQIWIYLRDPAIPPLPVHIGIWKQSGERGQRLRMLAGADDRASARKPEVAEVAAPGLGTGLRVLRYRERGKGELFAVLGYVFRSEEYETDVQVSAASSDLRSFMTATEDIAQLIQGMTVYYNPDEPR